QDCGRGQYTAEIPAADVDVDGAGDDSRTQKRRRRGHQHRPECERHNPLLVAQKRREPFKSYSDGGGQWLFISPPKTAGRVVRRNWCFFAIHRSVRIPVTSGSTPHACRRPRPRLPSKERSDRSFPPTRLSALPKAA